MYPARWDPVTDQVDEPRRAPITTALLAWVRRYRRTHRYTCDCGRSADVVGQYLISVDCTLWHWSDGLTSEIGNRIHRRPARPCTHAKDTAA